MKKCVGLLGIALALCACQFSLAAYSENFDTVNALANPNLNGQVTPSGWQGALRSAPIGSTGIFQGNDTVFPSQAGPPTSYAGMNFNNTAGTGTINTFMMTPELLLNNGDVVSFYTRTVTGNPFPDRLELRMSTAGTSTNVGNSAVSVGDFTTLLVSVNPNLTNAYPDVWTSFTATLANLPGPTCGRFALRYTVPDAGPTGANSNYIGVDTFETSATLQPNCVPEPASLATLGLGLLLLLRRRSK